MASIISYASRAVSLFSPLLRAVRSLLFYNDSGETQNDSDYSSDNSHVSESEGLPPKDDLLASGDNSPVSEPEEPPAMSSSAPLGVPPPKDDLLASGQGRTLILYVAANDSKMASLLFVEMTDKKFHIIINHSTKDLPFALQRPGACQTQRELQSLKAAILENKDFLKNRPFRFLAPSIPLFLTLLNGKKETLAFLNSLQFTIGFLGKERSHMPDILSGDNIFTQDNISTQS